MIHILIADDHPIVRRGLKGILSEESDMKVKGEAENGHEALSLLRKGNWSVAVLDMAMPGMSGLDLLKQVKSEFPKLPVLILSLYPEEQYAMRMLKAGASGYVTKEAAPDELVNAIRTIVSGRRYINPRQAELIADSLLDVGKQPHEMLSDREFEVMKKIAMGKRLTEIAKDLHLSVKTISTYRTRILEKMKMKSNSEIIRYALENKLAD